MTKLLNDFITPKMLTAKYPAFGAGTVRHYIFNARNNGFDKCMRRLGRKILISESLFVKWLHETTESEAEYSKKNRSK